MINPHSWIARVICLASLYSLLICCNKHSEREASAEIDKSGVAVEKSAMQESESEDEQEAEPDPQEVPVPEDFEAEAESTVDEDNYLTELDRLEKEIERE